MDPSEAFPSYPPIIVSSKEMTDEDLMVDQLSETTILASVEQQRQTLPPSLPNRLVGPSLLSSDQMTDPQQLMKDLSLSLSSASSRSIDIYNKLDYDETGLDRASKPSPLDHICTYGDDSEEEWV